MKKVILCVNLFCEDCGNTYEDYPSKRAALRQRKIECGDVCRQYSYHWCEFYRMAE